MKSNKTQHRIRFVINLILSFILTLLLTTILYSLSLRVGICNQDIFVRSVSDSTYYEELYENLTQHLNMMLEKAKLPSSVGEGVIDDSQVYIDGKVYITSVLQGKHPEIETEEIEEKLKTNIEEYLVSKDVPMDKMEAGIDEIVDSILIDYRNTLEFKMADYFYEYSQTYGHITQIVLLVSTILSLIIIVLLLMTHHRKYRGIRYISYAMISATLLNLILILQYSRQIANWNINTDSFYYQMIQNYLNEGTRQGYYICVGGMIVCIVLLATTRLLKKQKL